MASINIYLRNITTSNGKCPIVLRITKNRKSKLITLGLSCTVNEWDSNKNRFKKNHENAKQRNMSLLKLEQKANKIIDDFRDQDFDYTLAQFESRFRGNSSDGQTVLEFWEEKISDLIKAGRTGSARAYRDTKTSFFKFNKNKKLMFIEINATKVGKYETYLRGNGNKDGGIALKMRQLRAVFNDAIKKNVVDPKYYPFDTYKISKLKKSTRKIALTRVQIKLMESVDIDRNLNLLDTRNYLTFSYYNGGMNWIDMLNLKWSDIHGNRIVYIRSKTKKEFSIEIQEPIKVILEHYRTNNNGTKYVFPILLKDNLKPTQIENRKLKTLKKFNRELKQIAEIQGIEEKVTSYTIRHSFATNLKFIGVSTDLIGESMGHTDVSVTQAYLKDFEQEAIDDVMRKLL